MNPEIAFLAEEMEKDAGVVREAFGRVGDAVAGVRGLLRGARQAHSQHQAGKAFERMSKNVAQHAPNDPIARQALQAAQQHLGPMAQSRGFFQRVGDEFAMGGQAARRAIAENQMQRDLRELQRHAPQAHSAYAQPFQAAAPQAPQAAAPAAGGSRLLPMLAGGAALGTLGYAGYRGLQAAREQDARSQDYLRNAEHDMTAALPSMTVTASYNKLAHAKLGEGFAGNAARSFIGGMGTPVGERLIGKPIDLIAGAAKSKLYDEPRQRKNFEAVIKADPMLAQHHGQNPQMMREAFETIRRFSPTLAQDPMATRSLLKHVAMSSGEMDFATMKMLAETEKMHQESMRSR